MTNLQQNAPILSPAVLRRLWFGLPAALLSGGALLFGLAVLVPLWQSMQRDSTRLQDLQDLQQQVNLMRQQVRADELENDKMLSQRERLYSLIIGSDDVSTLMATLDREAKASGIRLDQYDPQASAAAAPAVAAAPGQRPAPAPAQAAAQPGAPASLASPALPNLTSKGVLISASGGYVQLLAFLRRLEALNVLVIQSNLALEAPQPSTDKNKPASSVMTMKLGLSLYSKSPDTSPASSVTSRPPGSNRANGT